MSRPLRKLVLLALIALAAVALGACGESHTRVNGGTYAGESGAAAPYLDVGPLVYQVQLSRELNPADTEDASYLAGLSPAQRVLLPGQEWFGVFMQVYNKTSAPHPAATNLSISDTQRIIYTPVIPQASNEYAYRGGLVPANSRVPALDTTAAQGATQGTLLLFKIQVVSLDNRPLTLKIVDSVDATQTASAELDV